MSSLDSLSKRKELGISGIELYYSYEVNQKTNELFFNEEESTHMIKVMRKKIGDNIYATDGKGSFFKAKLSKLETKEAVAKPYYIDFFANDAESFYFWIPSLKSMERLEFAIEKCMELGITNFVLYKAERSVGKNFKISRLEKIGISAMKQSCRFYLPTFAVVESLANYNFEQTDCVVLLEQFGEKKIVSDEISYLKNNYRRIHFIFGPEGGLTNNEINLTAGEKKFFSLSVSRLRTETAAVVAAAVLFHNLSIVDKNNNNPNV